MIRSATLQGEQANRRHVTLANGTGYWRSDLLISAQTDSPAPQAFLIEQDADTLIRPHFHAQDQFQVVAEGGGTLGRHALAPISVHYASRHTGYGPILAGPAGLSYFTLRAVTTPYAYFLPESRDRMEDLPRRNIIGRRVVLCAPEVLGARSAVAIEPIIESHDDGVEARLLRLPPDATHREDADVLRGDGFYLVFQGEMIVPGGTLPRFATAFVSAGERAFEVVAAAAGLEVLALHFARASR